MPAATTIGPVESSRAITVKKLVGVVALVIFLNLAEKNLNPNN